MTSKKNRARAPKELNKKFKKKTSVLVTDKVDFVDYKDVNLLNRFVSDRSKIRNRRVTGNTVQQQRDIANAVKNTARWRFCPTPTACHKLVPAARQRDRDEDGGGRRGEDGGGRRDSFKAEVAVPEVDAQLDDTVIDVDDDETVEA